MSHPPIRIVALLAEASGLDVLRETLLPRQDTEIAAVFTHLRRPEGEGRGHSAETAGFRAICREAGVALVFADGLEARELAPLLPLSELDLLISLGWRYPVDETALARFRLGRIELAAAAQAGAALDAALAEGRTPA